MGTNKDLRKKISGWQKQIAKHQDKIAGELEKPTPNLERANKWGKDIRIFENEIAKAQRKLPGGRR